MQEKMFQALKERDLPAIFAPAVADWQQRRGEIIAALAKEEYGFSPEAPCQVKAATTFCQERAWAGKAEHRQLELTFPTPGGEFSFPVHTVIPRSREKLPLCIFLSFKRYPIGEYGPIEEIIDHGFALATFCYQDVTADDDDFSSGLAAMYHRRGDGTDWGKLGMWAWAASRLLDYAQTLPQIDHKRIFSVGHSRLGKASLWCAAQDERFAAAVANDSGASGAAIARGKKGERIEEIVQRFPYWFCQNYHRYRGKEEQLPFDQHQLLAAIAPRPVYVASATEDLWADPESEFLSCLAASEAYTRLGLKGLVHQGRLPESGEFLHAGEIGYHLREGTHFLSRYDWQLFMRFMAQRI